MRVTEVMTDELATVPSHVSLEHAVEVMLRHRVGSVLVVKDGVVGILTRSDVLRLLYERGEPLDALGVRAAMTADVVTIAPDATVARALRTMAAHGVKRLPVREDFDVIGIITLTDIARHQPERVREVRATIAQKESWTD